MLEDEVLGDKEPSQSPKGAPCKAYHNCARFMLVRTHAPMQMIVMTILTTRRHSTALCIMRHLKAERAFKIALGLLAR